MVDIPCMLPVLLTVESDFASDSETLNDWRAARTPEEKAHMFKFRYTSRRSAATYAVAVLFAVALMSVCTAMLGASLSHASSTGACGSEDGASWVWSKCGNHKRGVVSMWGNVRVVGPCAFERMVRERTLDYTSSQRMRGDAWAVAHGCDSAHAGVYR